MNSTSSPKAFRRTEMLFVRLPSSTKLSDQSVLRNSSFSSKRPALRTSSVRVSNAFGVSWMI